MIQENPIAAAVAAAVAAGFVLFLVATALSGLKERRRRASIRHEPLFDRGQAGQGGDEPLFGTLPVAGPAARRGFGLAALVLAFLVGIVAGMGTLTMARKEIAAALQRLSVLVGPDPVMPGDGAAPPSVAGPPDDPGGAPAPRAALAEAGAVPASEVEARLAEFAADLRGSLPREAGPELSLTRVEVDGRTLRLGYGIGRVLPREEVEPFGAYVDRTVRSLFCAEEALEIRFLADNGAVFEMTYADPSGAIVKRKTVTADDCDSPAP